MNIGDIVTVCDSDELKELKLSDLVGVSAKIVEAVKNSEAKIMGYWVELIGEAYLDEVEWYIPLCSIAN